MNLVGVKQNTTTNDWLLFWYSFGMGHRMAISTASITKKASSNKSDAPIPLEVTFFTIYIHIYISFCFTISIPHTRSFVLLHYSTFLFECNNYGVKSRLILSKQTVFISSLAFLDHSFSVILLTHERCPKELQESLNNLCSYSVFDSSQNTLEPHMDQC